MRHNIVSNVKPLMELYSSDNNVYELDLNMWNLLATMAYDDPKKARKNFSVSPDFIEFLTSVKTTDLKTVSSGIMLSFKPVATDDFLLSKLNTRYDRLSLVSAMPASCNISFSYWSVVRNIAKRSIHFAENCFNLSRNLVEKIECTTCNQIHHFASNTVPEFRLRSQEDVIKDIAVSLKKGKSIDTSTLILKKLQQSMS